MLWSHKIHSSHTQYKSFPENRGSEMRVSGSESGIGGASWSCDDTLTYKNVNHAIQILRGPFYKRVKHCFKPVKNVLQVQEEWGHNLNITRTRIQQQHILPWLVARMSDWYADISTSSRSTASVNAALSLHMCFNCPIVKVHLSQFVTAVKQFWQQFFDHVASFFCLAV